MNTVYLSGDINENVEYSNVEIILNSDVQGFSHLIVGFWYYTTA